jgi:hypothetical protein
LVGIEGKLLTALADIANLKQQLSQALANKPSPGPTPAPGPIPSGFTTRKVWNAYAHLILDPGVFTNYNSFTSFISTLPPNERHQVRKYYLQSLKNIDWLKMRLSLSYF